MSWIIDIYLRAVQVNFKYDIRFGKHNSFKWNKAH